MNINNTNITIKELTNDIVHHAQLFNENYDPKYQDEYQDIRLQVVDDSYMVHWGDPSFDTDHRGFWGVSSLFPKMTKKECYAVAKELINDAADNYYSSI